MSRKFWEILFEDGEQTCTSDNVRATEVYSVHDPIFEEDESFAHYRFFVINPMHTNRKDVNVTCFRNILLEFDKGSLEEQQAIVETIPYSTLVFSGNKSLHAIISLAEPCASRAEYDQLVHRIMKKVPEADPSTKNPSRFSRTPGVLRENGKIQSLLKVRERVSKAQLDAWLGPEELLLTARPSLKPPMKGILKGRTMLFLAFGADKGNWNNELFVATIDLIRSQFTIDEAHERLERITGHLDKKDRSTIASAIKAVQQDG